MFKPHQFLILVAAACVVMAAVRTFGAPVAHELSDAKQRTVVLVSLDGFPAYALDDPKLPVPELRRLAGRGSWARRMTVTNPTVTWPNHTTLVTGVRASEHGVLFNGALRVGVGQKLSIDSSLDKEHLVFGDTLYDIAHARGLTTAQVAWVAIDRAPTIDWAFPEQPAATDALIQELDINGVLPAADAVFDSDLADAFHDQVRTKVASYLIRRYKPNLLMIHLAIIDSINHVYGPGTPASYNAMALADASVGELDKVLDSAHLQGGYTLVVVSDHGFKSFEKEIRPTDNLRRAGLGDKCSALSMGGTAMIYLKDRKSPDLPRLMQLFHSVPGVSSVADQSSFRSLGLPSLEHNRQMADLVIYAQTGYAFTDEPASSVTHGRATHGYDSSDPDMDGIFIASGYGIKRGIALDRIGNIDVAPTLAQLMGFRLPNSAGHVLNEIIDKQ